MQSPGRMVCWSPLRPGWLPSLGLVACGVFYLGLATLVFVTKQWPVLRGLIGL